MAALSPRAREILARAHSAERLSSSARDRMGEQLLERLSSGMDPLPGIDASPVVLPKLSPWLKLLGVVSSKAVWAGLALLCLGAGAGIAALRAPITPRPPTLQPTAAASIRVDEALNAGAPDVPETLEPVPDARPAVERPRPHPRRRAASPRPATLAPSAEPPVSPSPVPAPTPQPTAAVTLDAEFALLQHAHSELSAGHAAQALVLLERHTAEFPHGKLEQTREVARMLALCQLGRAQEARTRAQHFLAQHPSSPFAGRVRQVCSDSP